MTRRFPYVRLHVGFPDHPKNVVLSDAAFRVKVSGLCYSQEHTTDGYIPEAVALRWGKRATKELVSKGSWEAVEGGYLICNYLEWNDSKADITARANDKRVAGAIGAATRWGDSTTRVSGVSDSATGSALAGSGSRAKPRDQVYPPDFVVFWARYPLHVGKQAALKAWNQAVKRAAPEAIIYGASRFRDDPNRTDEFTPHPATWLNAGRWDDDPLPARGNGESPHRLDQHYARLREAAREG